MKLTAVVPITRMYGRLSTLNKWVNEALACGIEVVLSHDYQDPETEEELIAITKQFDNPLLKLVSKKVNSPGLARNVGLEQATGDWITFWDCDDIPSPGLYIRMIEIAESKGFDIAIGDFVTSDEQGEVVSQHLTENSLERTINTPGIWRYAFKKSRIQKKKFEKMKMGEDQLFLANLELIDSQIYFHNQIVYKYKIGHTGRLSNNDKAVGELIEAIRGLWLVQSWQAASNQFSNCLFVRLNLSLIKTGNISQKWFALINLITFLKIKGSLTVFAKVIKGIFSDKK